MQADNVALTVDDARTGASRSNVDANVVVLVHSDLVVRIHVEASVACLICENSRLKREMSLYERKAGLECK